MKTSNSTNYHIDRSILFFFLITILVTASVFSYKYANYIPCETVEFEYNASDFRVGKIIRFKDVTKGVVTEREWDFGDGVAADNRKSSTPFHTYDSPGIYNVKLRVNGRCESISRELTIKEEAFILDSSKLARFSVPRSIRMGELAYFRDKTPNAQKWEWKFGEKTRKSFTKKNPKYTYKTSGPKTITLVVNGDVRHSTSIKVNVLPKKTTRPRRDPVPQNPAIGIPMKPEGHDENSISEKPDNVVKAPPISEDKFKDKLLLVSAEKANLDSFSKYLCGNLDLPIIVNRRTTTFREFYAKIKGKRIRIKELKLTKDKNTNCITNIETKYAKTGLL